MHQLQAEESELKTLLSHVEKLLRHDLDDPMSKEEAADSQSWLDWGINLVKEVGPLLAKVAPELLALL